KAAGKDERGLLRDIAEKANTNITDADLQKAYDENKERLQGASLEQAKPFLKTQLEERKRREAVAAYLEQLKKQHNVQVLLQPPRSKVEAKGPAKGPEAAPITIVEFSDFECPYCSRARTTVEQVLSKYPGKIRLVFRDFPLDFHAKAQKA